VPRGPPASVDARGPRPLILGVSDKDRPELLGIRPALCGAGTASDRIEGHATHRPHLRDISVAGAALASFLAPIGFMQQHDTWTFAERVGGMYKTRSSKVKYLCCGSGI
jgi:hypothetical protein